MKEKFRYKYDKKSKILSVIQLSIMAILFACLYLLGDGDYIYAWIISIFIAIVALFILSIPRRLVVTEDAFEIQCVVELTRIEIRDIASIRHTTGKEHNRLYLLLGSYGFFGYYGYYFSFSRWEMIKVYATEWNNLIEIEDIYEQKYIVSCREADRLIELVTKAKEKHEEQKETIYDEGWDN